MAPPRKILAILEPRVKYTLSESGTLHSKNSGMNFIPIEYDFHPNEFHTYGMNSASMTFIPTAVRSFFWYEIHTVVFAVCGTPLGELGIPRQYSSMNRIADLI